MRLTNKWKEYWNLVSFRMWFAWIPQVSIHNTVNLKKIIQVKASRLHSSTVRSGFCCRTVNILLFAVAKWTNLYRCQILICHFYTFPSFPNQAPGVKPKLSPELLIDRYMRGEMHAVTLLHRLAQIFQFHLEMKETVTTGKAPACLCAFKFSSENTAVIICHWSLLSNYIWHLVQSNYICSNSSLGPVIPEDLIHYYSTLDEFVLEPQLTFSFIIKFSIFSQLTDE